MKICIISEERTTEHFNTSSGSGDGAKFHDKAKINCYKTIH